MAPSCLPVLDRFILDAEHEHDVWSVEGRLDCVLKTLSIGCGALPDLLGKLQSVVKLVNGGPSVVGHSESVHGFLELGGEAVKGLDAHPIREPDRVGKKVHSVAELLFCGGVFGSDGGCRDCEASSFDLDLA